MMRPVRVASLRALTSVTIRALREVHERTIANGIALARTPQPPARRTTETHTAEPRSNRKAEA